MGVPLPSALSTPLSSSGGGGRTSGNRYDGRRCPPSAHSTADDLLHYGRPGSLLELSLLSVLTRPQITPPLPSPSTPPSSFDSPSICPSPTPLGPGGGADQTDGDRTGLPSSCVCVRTSPRRLYPPAHRNSGFQEDSTLEVMEYTKDSYVRNLDDPRPGPEFEVSVGGKKIGPTTGGLRNEKFRKTPLHHPRG